MPNDSRLEEIRKRIDEIDLRLLELISERAALAAEVAEVKRAGSGTVTFYRPEREARIIKAVKAANQGPLSGAEIARLFREIMSACLALEQRLDIAYLGPEGTFTQTAVHKHFGHSVSMLALATIDQVFREVESGTCQFGVVPIENSIEGVINHTHDLLLTSPLKICGEIAVRIHHFLMSKSGKLEEVKKIYSHQQSLAQCRGWLDNHLPMIERIAVNSNAEAARIAGEQPAAAAVAGEAAAEYYGLQLLARNIEDEPNNTTRFMVIGHEDAPPSGNDKTSLILRTPNRPGALYKVLANFSDYGVSMTRIESRPSRQGMGDYIFFVDVEGHRQDQPVAAALKELEAHASMVKVIGSYPRAVL
jgi:chorismate mutase/prephenate dehydratase